MCLLTHIEKKNCQSYDVINIFFTYNYTRAFFCRSKLDISMRILLPGNLTKKTASGSVLSLIARQQNSNYKWQV
jgi:hypothetical protein